MIRNIRKFIFVIENSGLTKETIADFEGFRIETNISRINKPMIALFIMSIIQFIIDITYTMWNGNVDDALSHIFLHHVFMFFFCSLWFLFYYFRKKVLILKKINKVYYAVNIVLMINCIEISMHNLGISGQIAPFIIACFVSACGLMIPPIITILTFLIMSVVFFINLYFQVLTVEAIVGIVISVFITILLATAISIMNYSSFLKQYINNKILLETNARLEILEKDRIAFFANISHELRTPINIIYTANQMVNVTNKNNCSENKALSKYSNMIQQNCNRLIRLVENIIDITKIDALSFEVQIVNADIIKIIEDIYISIRDYVDKKGLRIFFNTEIEEKIIACDPYNIERIMLNILSNAIKFSKPNGEIIIDVTSNDNYIYISVEDTGIGIPEKMLGSIFDRFVQVDKSTMRQSEGSGIGLSLVKGLVELHDGTISVNSKLGEGSEFIIVLPDRLTDKENNISQLGFTGSSEEKVSIQFSDIY